ncbi:hypothetical protein [Weissella confusa]|uniref:hypothetical protein n=1 Tax=Weissella confusa TaxID=1583 RepID=UPI002A74A7D9|nr:hypothetical protein [Weissella confusa]MDY2513252.1 hypothetical protein [Weissella confusa]
MILDLPKRISGADDTSRQIYQAFYDVGMITDVPAPMNTLNIIGSKSNGTDDR